MKKITFYTILFLVPFYFFALYVDTAISSEVLQSLEAKLKSWDVDDIWPEVEAALLKRPDDPDLLETAAKIAYYRGDYHESLNLMKRATAAGGEDEHRQDFALFIEQTINVLAPFRRYETPHFIITLAEKQDGILVDYLTDALEKTYDVMARCYDFRPKEKVRVELFPDTKAFYLGSALSVRDIEVTGAVGLTKFNKLQFLSPKALVHGYRWLDAISHEYMHYLIMKLTSNKAPIWFHEGLSKYEETRWRNGPSYLSSVSQTLLAQAQADDGLIDFKKMEPSLLHLDTTEEVHLAYAQAASAIEFIIISAGHEGLIKIMNRMAQSRSAGAGEPIKAVMGLEFSEFEKKWRAFLASKGLQTLDGATIHRFKVREGKAGEEHLDLEEIKSLVARNRAHLGDKLKERGRLRAAVLEYRRALTETPDSVPVMRRLSSALIDLGRYDKALDILERTVVLAPDHPTSYNQLGRIYFMQKDFKKAKEAFEESLQINPFNTNVHVGLADTYALLGDSVRSEKEKSIVDKLRR